MRTRPFGKTGITVGAIGYGSQYLSLSGRPPEAEGLALIGHALARGATFIDTADTYCLGPDELHHNERLIARAVAGADALIGTKGSTVRTNSGWEINGSPERLYRVIRESWEALGGVRPITLWQLHWPDPRFSMAAMLSAARRAQDGGILRFCGVGNVSLEQLKQARDAIEVVSVQNQFNLWERDAERNGMIEYCEQHDIVFLPWRPMGGRALASRLGEVEPLAKIARERGVSAHRMILAWHLAKSPCILPFPGSTRAAHIDDAVAAAELRLEPSEIATLDELSPSQLPTRTHPPTWTGTLPLAALADDQTRSTI